ncbi:MAG TPA: hypothetical protein VN678_07635 [Acidobacteriaceae bacterium]|nr:hypothetical protein [Acidobacteriaceae bacterium]
MASLHRFPFAVVACSIVFFTVGGRAVRAQDSLPAATKLPFNAVLVLTPEFCATTFKQGSAWTTGRETFQVGKTACSELPTALKDAFTSVTVASAVPASSDAPLVLIPKFVNGHASTSALAFSNREMDVFLEWTVKDASGKTIWLQTVQGTSKHHEGNVFTHSHDVTLLARDSVKDVAAQSAAKMEAAPELRRRP